MKRPQLYLETTIWNFVYADDAPEKRASTVAFMGLVKAGHYDICISTTVLEEISHADKEKRELLEGLIRYYNPELLENDEETIQLATRYIEQGAIPAGKFEDALHAAAATVSQADALISWNLKHLANYRRIERLNSVNLLAGYHGHLVILTPWEVSDVDI